jgi:protein-tyrosine phosphatase
VDLIDIHAHILPGIDDGAQNLEQSMAMAEIAQRDGIYTMVATPHIISPKYLTGKNDILRFVADFNMRLERAGINLRILPGGEYRLEADLPERLAAGQLMTINNTGHYLMVELPSVFVPAQIERLLYQIQLQGVTPIIAHPERNQTFAGNLRLLKSFTDRGMLSQITSSSITGLFGRSIQRIVNEIIEVGSAHLLATDCHSANGRAPLLSSAYHKIEARWGSEFAQKIARFNPKQVINGELVEIAVPRSKDSLLKRLWAF